VAEKGQKFPGGHTVHAAAPSAALKLPPGQGSHVDDPARLNFPAAHSVEPDAAKLQAYPAGHAGSRVPTVPSAQSRPLP
jgi:hypothetical protein